MAKFDMMRDGGTIRITLDDGSKYFIDFRISPTQTKGMLYRGYPDEAGSYIVQNISELTKVSRFIHNHMLNEPMSTNTNDALVSLLRRIT